MTRVAAADEALAALAALPLGLWAFGPDLRLAFANPAAVQGAVREALRLAKKHGVRVAVTCSEAYIVAQFADAFSEALRITWGRSQR